MDKLSEETFVSKKEQNKLFCSYNNASMEFDRPGEKESDIVVSTSLAEIIFRVK